MRAKEFVVNVNVPIKINLGGNGEPVLDMPGYQSTAVPRSSDMPVAKLPKIAAKDPQELDANPKFVPPLQQQIEIQKALAGKQSPIIQDLLQDENEPDEDSFSYDDNEDDTRQIRNRY
jgi:hypothetical protein